MGEPSNLNEFYPKGVFHLEKSYEKYLKGLLEKFLVK